MAAPLFHRVHHQQALHHTKGRNPGPGWVDDGIPKAEVARRLRIGRTTLYKYLAGSSG
ncbi:helix-turn-helix domain-containing protein [Corynebacterium sp. p3-SID1145]|uniref:helix-turn-helix domain-containing protein n=1 Tax=unclassified Corynebacterium TaxID=2624378 RepID=UPI0021AB0A08|nr:MULTISPECIES: helix-turn-helix domain-containing protein [unclassified Corynebacterium]MCT1451952.1 helix-turn-helix domain-containing protein [Corynebacterium sp. p3-SID1145]MCT1461073.1 helix-turn-helix domain-containing protein [Corynebacterium sp. p3-SID1140]